MCGGSASGKTTVARKIIEELDVPWVTLLSLDSFYKVGGGSYFSLPCSILFILVYSCLNLFFHQIISYI